MKMVLKNGNVLSMESPEILYGADVWICNDKIERIEPKGSRRPEPVSPQKDVREIDCTGLYIMPGLIDSHVHYDEDYMGEMFLACGITSVRNMRGLDDHIKRREEILSGKRKGPFIFSTGPIYDGEDPELWNNTNRILRTEADVEEAIRYTMENGFLWMKTYPSIEPDLYRYLMRRCRENHLPVCGHMSKKMKATELADEGYYCCEHSSSLPKDPEDIRYLAKSGMWFCPTQAVCETLPDYVWNGKKFSDLKEYPLLPEHVRASWEADNERICESYRRQGIRPDIQVVIDRGKTFLENSDRFMAGSDCAYPGMIPGYSLLDELEKLVALYGCTPYEALKAATYNPALHMGLYEKKGRVAAGLDADLLILRENPLSDISNVRKRKALIQAGKLN